MAETPQERRESKKKNTLRDKRPQTLPPWHRRSAKCLAPASIQEVALLLIFETTCGTVLHYGHREKKHNHSLASLGPILDGITTTL